jgi:alkylation response protein AidB-like acyl-CoA dehydrogenase
MVGEVNSGWKVITDALAAERVMIGGTRMAGIERAFDHSPNTSRPRWSAVRC